MVDVNNAVFKVHHINVGKCDSSNHQTILIDAGAIHSLGQNVFTYIDQSLLHDPTVMEAAPPTSMTDSCHLERKPFDILINSHSHKNHLAGMPFIINSFMCDKGIRVYDQGKSFNEKNQSIGLSEIYLKGFIGKELRLEFQLMLDATAFYTSEILNKTNVTENITDIDLGDFKNLLTNLLDVIFNEELPKYQPYTDYLVLIIEQGNKVIIKLVKTVLLTIGDILNVFQTRKKINRIYKII